jgi:hypothetical protein
MPVASIALSMTMKSLDYMVLMPLPVPHSKEELQRSALVPHPALPTTDLRSVYMNAVVMERREGASFLGRLDCLPGSTGPRPEMSSA